MNRSVAIPSPDTAIDVRDGSRTWRVRPRDIIAAQAAANYAELRLADGRCLLARMTLSALAAALEAHGFVRVHRSWLVNPYRVVAAERTPTGGVVLCLERGLAAPISRRHRVGIACLDWLLDRAAADRSAAPGPTHPPRAARSLPGGPSSPSGEPSRAARQTAASRRRGAHAVRRYLGRCHCGDVRFAVEAEIESVSACDCSMCRRRGGLMHRVDEAHLELLSSWDALTIYKFQTGQAADYFCRRCGILPFRRPRTAPHLWAINVRCLEGLDLDALTIERAHGGRLP